MRLTREFWADCLPTYDAQVSELVLDELRATPEAKRRSQLLELVAGIPCLALTQDAANLAEEYQRRGIFTEKLLADALHVAVAVAHGIPYLASWNFKHLVRVFTRREVNLVNAMMGYGPVEIVAPPEL